jgi:hypothetical protein
MPVPQNRIKGRWSPDMNDIKKIILLICFPALLVSCGYYSFKGALPSHLKTIAVPLFNDRNTNFPNVRENLTNKVIDAFITDNSLKIADETQADILLSGTINSISIQASAVNAGEGGEEVREYKATVVISVKCEDIRMSKIMFERNFQQYGLLGSENLDERDTAIIEALDLLTEDIVNATLGGW